MTLCPECRPWAATTQRQLENSIRNIIHNGPDDHIFHCPKCDSIDWAITGEMIQDGDTHSWGMNRDSAIAGLATLSAIIIIALVLIGWWR